MCGSWWQNDSYRNFLEAEAGGRVTSLDIHAHKIKLINENAQRLNVADVVQAEKLDARQVAEEFPAETLIGF